MDFIVVIKSHNIMHRPTCCPVALLSLCSGLFLALGGLCRCWKRSTVSFGRLYFSCTSLKGDVLWGVRGSEMCDVCQSCCCLCCCRPAATLLSARYLKTQQHSVLHTRGTQSWDFSCIRIKITSMFYICKQTADEPECLALCVFAVLVFCSTAWNETNMTGDTDTDFSIKHQ